MENGEQNSSPALHGGTIAADMAKPKKCIQIAFRSIHNLLIDAVQICG